MIVLALDTATQDMVAGVVDYAASEPAASRVLAEEITRTRHHNEQLVPAVTRLLAQAKVSFSELDAIVVGCGPGPFTGLRVGMATASAFGQALGIPVRGVCTHDAIAQELRDCPRAAVVTDARRREVYWALYSFGRRIEGPKVGPPGELKLGQTDCVSVAPELAPALSDTPERTVDLTPHALGLVGACDMDAAPAPLTPLYLRRPDAVEPKRPPRSPALPPLDGPEQPAEHPGDRS